MKKCYCVSLFIILISVQFAATATTLRVGISQNPPLKFTDSTGEHTGLFVELLKEIGREEGWDFSYDTGSFPQCMEWLENGEIDVIPNIGYSHKRSQKFLFCNENVISTWAQVYCNPKLTINSINDMQGMRVAVQKDDVFINDPRDGFRYLISQFDLTCEFHEVSTYDDVLSLVESGQADAGIVNRVVGDIIAPSYYAKKTSVVFFPAGLRFAISKKSPGNKYLAETLDRYLSEWKDDPSSKYFEMMDRFYPVEKPRAMRGKALIVAFFRLYLPWIIAVAVALAVIIVIAVRNIVLNRRLGKQKGVLERQLEEIRTLQGLIPICYMCKKVKDDKGYWETVEKYVSKHSGAQFTHGICPACLEKYYPEEEESIGNAV